MDMYDSVFDETYESVLLSLNLRSEQDQFSLETIKGEFESLCRYDGLNWTGRASVKQAEIEGSILAYQAFLLRYREKDSAQ